MRGLSVEQGRTLTIVACLTLLHGRAPTLRQIASVLGCSKPAVHYRLRYLEKKGLWNAARWSLTEAGLSATRPLVDRAIVALVPHGSPAPGC
jgi:DNA-binding Lrp family transcriptional regulator